MSVAMHDEPKRGRGRPRGPGKKKDVHADAKYQRVRQLYLSGLNYEEIGAKMGVTRQRIEQMVRRLDLVSAQKRHDDFVAIVAGTVVRKGLTIAAASEMFKISKAVAYRYCHEHGVTPAKLTPEEQEEFSRLADAVKSGESINRAAGNHSKAEKLRRYLVKNGIKARGRSRHDDFSKRKFLLEKWRGAGKSWIECADLLSQHDGRKITTGGVYQWALRHMPHLFESVREAA
ncbi:hypothetical protein HJB80_02880 [Rhizobium lentis]|uniref:hypothetical protein n=1 Tax=Rhizobium lentis TaxID=1138194 RepID=UPI001C83C5E0|nr:hypothetical protein [Rhizobium lentis]MBX5131637.1 hypothetical protein [Rhizobium lentis]